MVLVHRFDLERDQYPKGNVHDQCECDQTFARLGETKLPAVGASPYAVHEEGCLMDHLNHLKDVEYGHDNAIGRATVHLGPNTRDMMDNVEGNGHEQQNVVHRRRWPIEMSDNIQRGRPLMRQHSGGQTGNDQEAELKRVDDHTDLLVLGRFNGGEEDGRGDEQGQYGHESTEQSQIGCMTIHVDR